MATKWIFWIYCICLGGLVTLLSLVPTSVADVIPADLCQKTQPERDGLLCYWLVSESTTWSEAQARCEQDGGSLAEIANPRDNEIILNLLQEEQVPQAWIGLTESVSSWMWISDGAEVQLQGCYRDDSSSRDLQTRTIFSDATQDMCVEYCKEQGYKYAGMQARTSCFCGDSFGKYGSVGFGAGGCSQVCPGDPARINKCGGELSSVIISVHAHTEGAYENWLNGQPNNHQGYQTCAAIELDDEYRFNDIKCMERLGTICHMDELNSTECEAAGYTLLNGTWCLMISNDSQSWFVTRQRCLQQNGHMLEIRDPVFDSQLSDFLLNRTWANIGFWLGLTKGKWKWQNGDDAIFTAWHPDRPNGADQKCAATDSRGEWNDVSCTAVFPAVCLIDNSTLPTTAAPTTTESITSAAPEEEGITVSDRNFYLIMAGVGLVVLILFIVGMCQLKLCCKDPKQKNKNDFFFEFDTKGSSAGEGSNLEEGKEAVENGYINKGFDRPHSGLDGEPEYTDIEGVTEDVTSSSTAQLTVHQVTPHSGRNSRHSGERHSRPKSEEQKAMETFDLIADLDDKNMDSSSIDAKTMIY